MSNFAYLLILFSFNSITLIGLILISINKKSPRVLLKFLFFPVLLTLFLGVFIQLQFEISDISLRQLLSNLIVIAWCLKSFNAYSSIKSLLLQEFLESIRDLIHQKKILIILITTIKISFIQIACFSSVLSLNYLSGYSSLNFLDILRISHPISLRSIDLPMIFLIMGSFVMYFPKNKTKAKIILIIVGFM